MAIGGKLFGVNNNSTSPPLPITLGSFAFNHCDDLPDLPKRDLVDLLGALSRAARRIAAETGDVRKHMADAPDEDAAINPTGDRVKHLDIASNTILREECTNVGSVHTIASEEEAESECLNPAGKYALVYDPVDGSSNLGTGITMGSIIGAYRADAQHPAGGLPMAGRGLVLACYVIYGLVTQLLFCTAQGAHLFAYDVTIGDFRLVKRDMRMVSGAIYSVNDANLPEWSPRARAWLGKLRDRKYSMRYVGSLVVDFHRNLLQGGVFAYPATSSKPHGKLRLVYELAPLAFIAEVCGGMAINDNAEPILDISPEGLHHTTGAYIGSKTDLELF